jgi:hypothetical protein
VVEHGHTGKMPAHLGLLGRLAIQVHLADRPVVEPGHQQHPTTALLPHEAVGEPVALSQDRDQHGKVGIRAWPDLHLRSHEAQPNDPVEPVYPISHQRRHGAGRERSMLATRSRHPGGQSQRGLGQQLPLRMRPATPATSPTTEKGHAHLAPGAILSRGPPRASARPRPAPWPQSPQPGRHAPWPSPPPGPRSIEPAAPGSSPSSGTRIRRDGHERALVPWGWQQGRTTEGSHL